MVIIYVINSYIQLKILYQAAFEWFQAQVTKKQASRGTRDANMCIYTALCSIYTVLCFIICIYNIYII